MVSDVMRNADSVQTCKLLENSDSGVMNVSPLLSRKKIHILELRVYKQIFD